jgi:hypothetical protein
MEQLKRRVKKNAKKGVLSSIYVSFYREKWYVGNKSIVGEIKDETNR